MNMVSTPSGGSGFHDNFNFVVNLDKAGIYSGPSRVNNINGSFSSVSSLGPIEEVQGSVSLDYCSGLTSLGKLSYVSGSLDISSSPVVEMPALDHVGGRFIMSGNIPAIPSLGMVRSLRIIDGAIPYLPNLLSEDTYIEIITDSEYALQGENASLVKTTYRRLVGTVLDADPTDLVPMLKTHPHLEYLILARLKGDLTCAVRDTTS